MLSMAPLLMHSSDVPAPVREALIAAYAGDPDERDERLVFAARMMARETELECADVRELLGLADDDCTC